MASMAHSSHECVNAAVSWTELILQYPSLATTLFIRHNPGTEYFALAPSSLVGT